MDRVMQWHSCPQRCGTEGRGYGHGVDRLMAGLDERSGLFQPE